MAGLIADRFRKRRILLAHPAVARRVGLLLGVARRRRASSSCGTSTSSRFLQGVATAVDNPARQSFVSEMVPDDQLTNAVALNSASFNAGRLIGPAVAGLVIAALGADGRCCSTG